jgi:hypothetical protein
MWFGGREERGMRWRDLVFGEERDRVFPSRGRGGGWVVDGEGVETVERVREEMDG